MSVERGVDLDDAIRSLIENSEDGARSYLKQSWISLAMEALANARRTAGLTQAQIAQRLGTTQSAVARVENDDSGGISLRRYIDYVLACDAFPADIEFHTLADVREFAMAKPNASRSAWRINIWKVFQDLQCPEATVGAHCPQSERWQSRFDVDVLSATLPCDSSRGMLTQDGPAANVDCGERAYRPVGRRRPVERTPIQETSASMCGSNQGVAA